MLPEAGKVLSFEDDTGWRGVGIESDAVGICKKGSVVKVIGRIAGRGVGNGVLHWVACWLRWAGVGLDALAKEGGVGVYVDMGEVAAVGSVADREWHVGEP